MSFSVNSTRSNLYCPRICEILIFEFKIWAIDLPMPDYNFFSASLLSRTALIQTFIKVNVVLNYIFDTNFNFSYGLLWEGIVYFLRIFLFRGENRGIEGYDYLKCKWR